MVRLMSGKIIFQKSFVFLLSMFLFVVILLFWRGEIYFFLPSSQDNPDIFSKEGEYAEVSRVIDGDTAELSDGRRVRYIGIDTPESKKENIPKECFSEEASARNRDLVEGKKILLIRDVSDTDVYGRLLRYVYEGEVFVNARLVEEGYARKVFIKPDVSEYDLFSRLEEEAKREKRGLWGKCVKEKMINEKEK